MLQALACQLPSGHLSFSESWFVCWLHKPGVVLGLVCPASGTAGTKRAHELLQAPSLRAIPSSAPSPLTQPARHSQSW